MISRLTCLLTLVLCGIDAPAWAASGMGHAAADEVRLANYYDLLDNWLYTHTGDDRGLDGLEHDLARNNISLLLESYGLDVTLHPFVYEEETYYNVVATQLGMGYPDQEYILSAHFDSVGNPGADDDASGVALMLETARILSQYDSACTIRYIAFDREEQGLKGSAAYVDDHYLDDIRGMISADMVAYASDPNFCYAFADDARQPIKESFAAAVEEYSGGLTCIIGGPRPFSDHAFFELEEFQALLFTEGDLLSNPYYHTPDDSIDTPDYLNFEFATRNTRSVVGWLVDAAGVTGEAEYVDFVFPEGRPEYSRPAGGTTIRVEVVGHGAAVPQPGAALLHCKFGLGWSVFPMQVVADNVYDAVLPARVCGAEIQYYFSVPTATEEVFTHPCRAPDVVHGVTATYDRVVMFEDYLDADPGWSTQGEWEFGQPTGGCASEWAFPDPTSGATGDYVYGINLAGCHSGSMGAPQYLTLGPLDLSAATGVRLEFQRWLNVDGQTYVLNTVEVSAGGGNWHEVWDNGWSKTIDYAWTTQDFDISAYADEQPEVYVRWGHTVGLEGGPLALGGWNIDDVVITALQCEPALILGDLNCDGAVDFFDIDPFVLAITDPGGYTGEYAECDILAGDCNDDGLVDFFDIEPFVELIVD